MDIGIFDVGHGFCSALFADNGNVMLVDCGANEETGFRPSRFLPAVGCGEVQVLVVSNYDEDHMRDLPGLLSTPGLQVRYLSRNRSRVEKSSFAQTSSRLKRRWKLRDVAANGMFLAAAELARRGLLHP